MIAASVYPDDARIAEGRSRVQRLPQIIELFADADRAKERNDMRTVLAKYRAIQALDPKTQGLQAPLGEAQSRVANLDYQGTLSAGYAALDAGDYDAAKRAFETALRQRPNDGAAQDGMSQVEQRSTLSNIEQYHQKAIRDEADERWTDAVASYQKVLAVDGSIKFAMDGKARAGARADLDRKLNAALADPGALSSDATYADVTALYQNAAKIADPGPRLTDQLKRLEQALALAKTPVPVTLTSDAATEVTISQLGALGKFARKEVQLRPGRYVLHRQPRRQARRAPRTDGRAADAAGGNRLPGIDLTVSADEQLIRPATFTPTRDDLHGRSWFGEHRVQLISTAVLLAVGVVRLVHLHGEVGAAHVRPAAMRARRSAAASTSRSAASSCCAKAPTNCTRMPRATKRSSRR